MMKDIDTKNLLVTLTIEEYSNLQKKILFEHQKQVSNDLKGILIEFFKGERKPTEKKYVSGIKGIAKLFDVSVSTAARYKAEGWLDEAIQQKGNVIRVDEELALKLFKQKWQKRID